METSELREFLNQKVQTYNSPEFIETDPIQVPHQFSIKEDIEIAGFLTATIAWGNRKTIIKNAHKMMTLMGYAPYDFVLHHSDADLNRLTKYVHRTFNGRDFIQFIKSLHHIYTNYNGLEQIFTKYKTDSSLQPAISKFKSIFFEIESLERTKKHISDPLKNSAAKRINMFLRWMVRKDNAGVDFGIWNAIPQSILSCPLDVHSGNVARKLNLIHRKQNDAKALTELDTALRNFDPNDPTKYDFALFGLGLFENF